MCQADHVWIAGKPHQVKKHSKLRFYATDILNSKRWCLGLPEVSNSETS